MRAFRDAVRGLAQAVDARDSYTREHSGNVSELATALCHVLGLSDAEAQVVALAALVHDVGKVGVDDDVLLSGDTPSEHALDSLRQHPVLGERILEPARIDDVLPIVRHHHERWDGTGYPDGLVATAIPLGARILTVCDVFESLTAPRAWRSAMSSEAALAHIESEAGRAFDPSICGVFVRMVRRLGAHDARGPEGQAIGV
jgi:putative nucleotidyltransferase with HDIG domain